MCVLAGHFVDILTFGCNVACFADGQLINFTLINLVLHVLGPMRERTLCTLLLVSLEQIHIMGVLSTLWSSQWSLLTPPLNIFVFFGISQVTQQYLVFNGQSICSSFDWSLFGISLFTLSHASVKLYSYLVVEPCRLSCCWSCPSREAHVLLSLLLSS